MNEREDASQPQEQAGDNAQPPVQPPSDPPPPQQQPCPEHAESADKISKSDRIMVAATIVIAVGTLVSAGAIVLQWREMIGGGQQTDALIKAANTNACAARKSAAAAKSFADTAALINTNIGLAERDFSRMANNSTNAIKATQEAMRLDQRAWVGVTEVGPPRPAEDDPGYVTIPITIVNTGKTPARNTFVRYNGKVSLEDHFSVPRYISPLRSIGVIQPGMKAYDNITVKGVIAKPMPRMLRQFSTDINLYFFGEVVYDDIFGQHHSTRFCARYPYDSFSGQPNFCDTYNEAD